MRPEYPPRPGHRTDWEVLAEYRSEYIPFLLPRRLPGDRLFPSAFSTMFQRLLEERRRGSWARVALEARHRSDPLAYLDLAPGNDLFGSIDVSVVNRYRVDAWAA